MRLKKNLVKDGNCTHRKLVIFVCNGSSHMLSWDDDCAIKGLVVAGCIRETILVLRKIDVKEEFDVAQITFDRRAELRLKPTLVGHINLKTNFNPLAKDGGSIAVLAALNLAYHTAEKFLLNGRHGISHKVVVLMISDENIHTTFDDLIEIVRKFKANKKIVLATALYGRADTNLLKELATDPGKYCVCNTADQLGDFILAVALR